MCVRRFSYLQISWKVENDRTYNYSISKEGTTVQGVLSFTGISSIHTIYIYTVYYMYVLCTIYIIYKYIIYT